MYQYLLESFQKIDYNVPWQSYIRQHATSSKLIIVNQFKNRSAIVFENYHTI